MCYFFIIKKKKHYYGNNKMHIIRTNPNPNTYVKSPSHLSVATGLHVMVEKATDGDGIPAKCNHCMNVFHQA